MDAVIELLERIRAKDLARGRFRGFLHVLIGRRIVTSEGKVVSHGLTFRDVATLLRKLRWDPEDVRQLGLEPERLPVRDRQRYWFTAICQAGVSSPAASTEADELAAGLAAEGYRVESTQRV